MVDEIQKACLDAIINSDRETVDSLIENWAKENGYENVIVKVLEPVLEELGNMWAVQKEVTFAQAYVSATIAESIILKALKENKNQVETIQKGTIIIGNIEDDYHSLGRRLLGIFLVADGWNVIDLGNDVTPSEFVDKAIEENSKIIAVSAMMYTTAQNIIKLRHEIDSRGYKDKIMLAVGGAVFNLRSNLWKEVGADGTSRNAIDVGKLMDKLLDKANCRGDKYE